MTVFAIYNIKGGVGKTATAVNLAWFAAREGPALIIDLDPQSAATYYFRVKPKLKKGLRSLFKGDEHLAANIKATDFPGLDLLPADFSLRNLDLAFERQKNSKKGLAALLKPLREEYATIWLDCPPNLTLVAENVFHASDILLSPMIPTTLSLRTYEKLLGFYDKEGLDRRKLLPFFSMVEARKSLQRETMKEMQERFPELLASYIPCLADIERMGIQRAPVPSFLPRSKAALAYQALWDEVRPLL